MDVSCFMDRALNVPFLEKGRSYEGWDCWGMIYVAYRELYGIELPLYTGEYSSTRRRTELQGLIDRNKGDDWILAAPHQPGDVALTRMLGRHCHVGLMVGDWWMLHVQDGVQAAVERLDAPPWRGPKYNKVEGIYHHVTRA